MKESRRRFTAEEYTNRQQATRNAMQKSGVDLLIIANPANIYWLTGYDSWSFYVHQFVIISTDGDLFWYGRGVDAAGAILTTDLPEQNILTYPDHYVQSPDLHPAEHLAELLVHRGLSNKTTGVEKDSYYFTARAMEALATTLPGASYVDCTSLVNHLRAIKSAQELEYMYRAGTIIEATYQRVIETAKPGMRKNELVAEILHATTYGTDEHYGDYTAIVPLIGAGDESSACHMTWDGSEITTNSGVFLELAAAHARYHCPCSRTLYFGKPPQKYLDIEKVIGEGIARTLEAFVPGNSCGKVAGVFFDFLEKNGYEKDNRCGYSIGVAYPPDWGEHTMSLRRNDTTELQQGMCFHFMPGMWFSDWGFETTEAITVTEKGGQCLSQVPRQLLVID